MKKHAKREKLSSGIKGLDEILSGGFLESNSYLITGGPGNGKTTFCLHFLEEGSKNGEPCLFITLGEKEEQIRKNAGKLGLKLENVHFLDLSPSSKFFIEMEYYDIFSPAEVEREPVTQAIKEKVEALKPKRVVIDSMTHFRYLATDVFQFRRQVLSFLRFLTENGATVLFTAEASVEAPDSDLRFLADGIIELSFSEIGRQLEVKKYRGSEYLSGQHYYEIKNGCGIVVFPRLLPTEKKININFEKLSSGIPEIDELLYGGIESGTVTIISGPSGTGKTTLGLQFIKEASGRGERSVVYTFEESVEKIVERALSINIPIKNMIDKGTLEIKKIEPLIYTPYSFAQLVKEDVEKRNTKIVMIDSTSGYKLSVRGAEITTHLHALCKYLNNQGVTVFLPTEIKKITGEFQIAQEDISYLADNVIILRYIEIKGELRRAIGVLKKRLGDFEKNLREFQITKYGIKVGEPLKNMRNILSGAPSFIEET
ncbi:ATPase domain-containing protein [Thermodesulfobacterium hveragerdense]|uniref:ATPase domain-containing protein n=2 Tax=Thermodesulfobacterium TaxID=1740 RepID=UPI0004220A27|nr:ATPase domain-containing protein [Thermodesulfobacterium hveragerdense]